MPKKKMKQVVITPQGRRAQSSPAQASARSAAKRRQSASARKGWRASDIHFDSKGRLVVRNQKLARKILDIVEGNSSLMVITPPLPIRNPRPPDPADAMCGCNLIEFVPDEIRKIHGFGRQGKDSSKIQASGTPTSAGESASRRQR